MVRYIVFHSKKKRVFLISFCRNFDEDMDERVRSFFASGPHLAHKLRFQCARCHFFFFLGFVPCNRLFNLKAYLKQHEVTCRNEV